MRLKLVDFDYLLKYALFLAPLFLGEGTPPLKERGGGAVKKDILINNQRSVFNNIPCLILPVAGAHIIFIIKVPSPPPPPSLQDSPGSPPFLPPLTDYRGGKNWGAKKAYVGGGKGRAWCLPKSNRLALSVCQFQRESPPRSVLAPPFLWGRHPPSFSCPLWEQGGGRGQRTRGCVFLAPGL